MNLIDCDTIERFGSDLLDDIPEQQRDHFENHIESCTACQNRLDSDAAAATLREMGRRIGDPTAQPLDPTLQSILKTLREQQPFDNDPSAVDLYFLDPSDDEELLGTLGPYEIHEIIGQGGMGIVLKADELSLQRWVAVKVLSPALAGSTTARQRFLREARASASIRHENIVTVHAVDEIQGVPYFVMEYVAGESLQDRLNRAGPLPLEELVSIARQVADGLAAAHSQGLIHRDIKPANILLDDTGCKAMLTDFGLARLVDDVHLTQNGAVVGTPEYMAPEQARGEAVDCRADLFGFGGVLYAMCTGRPPYAGLTTMAVLRSICDDPQPMAGDVNTDAPIWLDQLIASLMVKSPNDRLSSADEVATLLDQYQRHLELPDVVSEPVLPPLMVKRTEERRPFPWKGILVAVLLVAGIGYGLFALLFAQSSSPSTVDFYHDFRGKPLPRQLDFYGGAVGKYFYDEPEGFRITLPKDWKHPWGGSGLATTFGLEGDFEITTTVEILNAKTPSAGFGSGIRLYINKVDSREGVTFCRLVRPGDQQILLCDQTVEVNVSGKMQPRTSEFFVPCNESKLKLRMKRRGATVYFLWAPMNSKLFTEIRRKKFGSDPVKRVVLTAINGRQPVELDVRFIDLRIRSGQIAETTGSANQTEPSDSAGSLTWLIGGIIVAGIGFAATWFFVRKRRAASIDQASHGSGKRSLRNVRKSGLSNSSQSIRSFAIVMAPLLVAAIILGWSLPAWFSGDSEGKEPPPREIPSSNEFVLDLRGGAAAAGKLQSAPANNKEFVKTEKDGLRITLPEGLEGIGEGVQLTTEQDLKGNFDIVLDYEMLAEPDGNQLRESGGLGLVIATDSEKGEATGVYRSVYRGQGSSFTAWAIERDGEQIRLIKPLSFVATQSKKGKLRLARIGSTLYYYVAGDDGLFNLFNRFPFGKDDVKSVSVFASTGGPDGFLDARITKLTMRADSLPATNPTPSAESETTPPQGFSMIVLAVVLALIVLGAVLVVRRWLVTRQFDMVASLLGLCSCLFLLVVGLWMADRFAGAAELPTQSKTAQTLVRSLKQTNDFNGMDLIGPGAAKCIHFEPVGLRIALPKGWPGNRPVTGVTAPMVIKGDFDISIRYEIRKEPDIVDRGSGMRLSLVMFLNTEKPTVATINRRVGEIRRKLFVAWISRWDESLKKLRARSRNLSTEAMNGRLRVVRRGSVLSYLVADGESDDFLLLRQYDFGDADVKELRIAGSTGDKNSELEAIVTDLRIQAESISGVSSGAATASSGHSSLFVLSMILLALSMAGLGAWWFVRQKSLGESSESAVDAAAAEEVPAATIAVTCTNCGKRMRTRSRLAGKKIKCPQCGSAVAVRESSSEQIER